MLSSVVNSFETTGATASTSYTFNYPIHKAADLKVYVAGVLKEIDDSTYAHTVTVAANKQSASVAFTTASSVDGKALKFERIVEYKQETDLANNSLLDAESLETSLDNIVMQTQQAGLKAEVSFGFDPGIAASDYNSTASYASTLNVVKASRKNKALAFDANGDITVSTDDIDAQISAVAASATSAASSATASASSATASAASLAEFQGIYRGSSTSTPGSPTDGDLWFDTNTSVDVMKVYNATASAWEQLTPTSSNQTNINAAVADASDIGKVAALDAELGRLGTTAMSTASTGHLALLGTSAMANSTDGDIKVVADAVANVNAVAAVDDEIALLGTSAMAHATTGHLALLGTSAMAHASTGHIKKVADVDSHVAALGPISTAISGVNTISSEVVAVNGDAVDIGKVAAIDDEVAKVAALETEIGLIGTNAYSHATTGYIKLVADDATDIGAVAGKATEIGLLGTSAMATASSGHLALLGTSTVVANIATVAGSIADVNRYANEYKIASSAPGSPSEGDMWSDTTNKTFKVYNGTSWATVTEGQSAEEVNATSISMAIALG